MGISEVTFVKHRLGIIFLSEENLCMGTNLIGGQFYEGNIFDAESFCLYGILVRFLKFYISHFV